MKLDSGDSVVGFTILEAESDSSSSSGSSAKSPKVDPAQKSLLDSDTDGNNADYDDDAADSDSDYESEPYDDADAEEDEE